MMHRIWIVVIAVGVVACGEAADDAAEFREWCVEPPSEQLASEGADAVLTLVPDGSPGLGGGISARINGVQVDLRDDGAGGDAAAGDDIYAVPVALPEMEAPAEHTCFPVEDGEVEDRKGKVKISCKTVPCPPDCKSIIFGEPCTICLECTFDISFLEPSAPFEDDGLEF